MATGNRVLVVEDEPRYARLLALNFRGDGYQVDTVGTVTGALQRVGAGAPDLIVLDLGLPDGDGLALCQRLRELCDAPIIVLTARAQLPDRVRGLDAGADDYLTKPFAPEELLARARAVLRRGRRTEPAHRPTQARFGELLLDYARGRVTLAGQELALSPTEYRLLGLLAQSDGRLLVPDAILERIWGPEYRGETHLVRLYISRLRKKLGDDPERPRYIETRPGIGYRFCFPPQP